MQLIFRELGIGEICWMCTDELRFLYNRGMLVSTRKLRKEKLGGLKLGGSTLHTHTYKP